MFVAELDGAAVEHGTVGARCGFQRAPISKAGSYGSSVHGSTTGPSAPLRFTTMRDVCAHHVARALVQDIPALRGDFRAIVSGVHFRQQHELLVVAGSMATVGCNQRCIARRAASSVSFQQVRPAIAMRKLLADSQSRPSSVFCQVSGPRSISCSVV